MMRSPADKNRLNLEELVVYWYSILQQGKIR